MVCIMYGVGCVASGVCVCDCEWTLDTLKNPSPSHSGKHSNRTFGLPVNEILNNWLAINPSSRYVPHEVARHHSTASYPLCIRSTARYLPNRTHFLFAPLRSKRSVCDVAKPSWIIHSKRLLKLFMHSAIQHKYFASFFNSFVRSRECAFGLPFLCFCLSFYRGV